MGKTSLAESDASLESFDDISTNSVPLHFSGFLIGFFCVSTCACVRVHVYSCACVCVYVYVCSCVFMCVHVCAYLYYNYVYALCSFNAAIPSWITSHMAVN